MRKVLKWGAIGGGGLIGLFVVLLVVIGIVTESDGDSEKSNGLSASSSEREMEVTREVPVNQQAEVTRQIMITRVVTATPRPTPRPTPNATPIPSVWYKLELEQDRITDERSIGFTTQAIYHNIDPYTGDIPTLAVFCRERDTPLVGVYFGNLVLIFGTFPGYTQAFVRFGDREADETNWAVGEGGQSIFLDNAGWFVDLTDQYDAVFIRLKDYTEEAEFEVRGLSDIMATEPELCGT